MIDINTFNPNAASNPLLNIFGLPFSKENAELIILPVPWEATININAGTARCMDPIFEAGLHFDLHFHESPDIWKRGIHMLPNNTDLLLKSDYLRKEAELLVDYTCKGASVQQSEFMKQNLQDLNQGGVYIYDWVYDHTIDLITKENKIVGLLGGAQSICVGYLKALSEIYSEISVLQIDAHCDLRTSFQGFSYSHASCMHNVCVDDNHVTKIVQVGIRDYCEEEAKYVNAHKDLIKTFFQEEMDTQMFNGKSWDQITDDIVSQLSENVYISFDIDGLDALNCPNTSMPIAGGMQFSQVTYLLKKIAKSGKKIIGFDLSEVGVGSSKIDANVGARALWYLCNWTLFTHPK